MATLLYKLGRLAFKRRRVVALIWVALLALVGFGAATAASAPPSSFSIPGTEAQKAFDLLDQRFPSGGADGATARVVFKAPEGQQITDPDNKTTVENTVRELKSGSDQVASVADPFAQATVSSDGTTAYTEVAYKVGGEQLTDQTKHALEDAGTEAKAKGLQVEIGGDALQAEVGSGVGEVLGLAVAAVVLVVTLGSLIAAGLPLLTAILGVAAGIAGITILANPLGLDSSSSTLAMMIGLAVCIDYALFIVSRYRAELAQGREREEAAGRAVGTAGSAVVFAGLTVVIALAGLTVVDIPMLTKMGLAAAGTVLIAVLIALTLVPALLGFAGNRILSRQARKAIKTNQTLPKQAKENAGARWGRFVLRHPLWVLLVGVLGLGAVALPAASLNMGMPDDGSQPTSTTQRRAYDLLAHSFGPGFNGPLLVVVDGTKAAAERTAADIKTLEGVDFVAEPILNEAGDTAMITVVPKERPSSGQTKDLVHDIRHANADIKADTGGTVLVTGATAMNIDFSQKMNDALLPYLALVVGLAFLLLMVVFRSVLVPLKAALGFLLSVIAALGAVVAVFQWGWLGSLFGVEETAPIVAMMPIFMVGVTFGLAMDYEVFLITRMREAYVHGEKPRQAIITGFEHGARVVTAAAMIMIAVFSGFITSSEQMIKLMGFCLAIAVLFDAFVIRMAVVPAVLALLGHKAWWLPKWLDRLLPSVDVEGEGLPKELADCPEGPTPESELVNA